MPLRKPPYAYRHPDKKGDEVAPDGEATVQVDGGAPPLPREPQPALAPSERSRTKAEPGAIRVRIIVPVILAGSSARFDALARSGVDAKVATLRILDHALPAYLTALANGMVQSAPGCSDGKPGAYETTRRLASSDLRLAKAALDPHGIWRPNEFGRIFGRAIMQHWMAFETLAAAKETDGD